MGIAGMRSLSPPSSGYASPTSGHVPGHDAALSLSVTDLTYQLSQHNLQSMPFTSHPFGPPTPPADETFGFQLPNLAPTSSPGLRSPPSELVDHQRPTSNHAEAASAQEARDMPASTDDILLADPQPHSLPSPPPSRDGSASLSHHDAGLSVRQLLQRGELRLPEIRITEPGSRLRRLASHDELPRASTLAWHHLPGPSRVRKPARMRRRMARSGSR